MDDTTEQPGPMRRRVAPSDGAEPAAPNDARRFIDREGRPWTVAEEPFPRQEWTSADEETHRAGHPVGWLRFTSAGLRRRLRLFPARWRTLPPAELERLCRRAMATD